MSLSLVESQLQIVRHFMWWWSNWLKMSFLFFFELFSAYTNPLPTFHFHLLCFECWVAIKHLQWIEKFFLFKENFIFNFINFSFCKTSYGQPSYQSSLKPLFSLYKLLESSLGCILALIFFKIQSLHSNVDETACHITHGFLASFATASWLIQNDIK